MRRDNRLYELNDDEFERLAVRICTRWLGEGVIPFALGRDGGRDGRFDGTATSFPSATAPISGKIVIQAKHVSAPDKSCSDRDFKRLLDGELAKVKALIDDDLCDHYIVFTNRKLTGGSDAALLKKLRAAGLKSAHIVGIERIDLALEEFPDIRTSLPNARDALPFRFDPLEFVEVIGALHDFTGDNPSQAFDSAQDFDAVKIRDEKNKYNGLSDKYYAEIIVNGSMPHFSRVEDFLKNARNKNFADLYHDAADELKAKILKNRSQFPAFDDVFAFLYEQIQARRSALRGKRRLVSILLHYMYCNCDIGDKSMTIPADTANANA